jgi:NAD(P)-dependent dehydrogenase (short-subunit alcohol dehydrogenase family)
MEINLTGKRALVSGSTSGIGAETARLLASCGATVVVHGRNNARAEKIVAEISQKRGDAFAVLADLCSDEDVVSLTRQVNDRIGGIDILVNNAGDASPFSPDWFAADCAAWLAAYDRNVVSAVRLIHAFVPGMRERKWGRVINVGSGSYATAVPDFPAYGPCKAAVANMTFNLARALARTGVTVNLVSPGAILTETMQSNLQSLGQNMGWTETDPEELERRLAQEKWPNNIGRMGRPIDIAASIAFLASDFSAHMSASNLRVDGGESSSFH